MTPYQQHHTVNHHSTFYSPNGIDVIEECADCGARWLHHFAYSFPLTLEPAVTAGT